MFKKCVACPELELGYKAWTHMDIDTTGRGPNACDGSFFVFRTSQL